MQEMQPHPLAKTLLKLIRFAKFGQKWLDLANLIRFGKYQSLSSPKISDILRL